MPFAMSDYIQSVIIQEMMYVGGGHASSINNMYIVMTYNIISQEWSQLTQYTACLFAMTIIHNKLTLVGGCDRYDKESNVLGVWDADRRKWTLPYTPMPTPRYNSSAVVYRQWLIVAGGRSGGTRTSSVEVLHNSSERIWNTISSLGLYHSTPVCMGESLLAVCGWKSQSGESVSTILHFIPDRNEWREVEQLQALLHDVACTLTSNNRFLVAHINKFHIGV